MDNVPAHPTAHPERGAALLVSLGILVLVGILAATLATLVGGNVESHISQQVGNQAFFMAESGARYAIGRLRQDGMAAVAELDGNSFELENGWGFELAVTGQDLVTFHRFRIESTGFVGQGAKHQLNSYQIDIPKDNTSGSDSPVAFPFAMQLVGGGTASISGSSYIDSYDSELAPWTTRGGFRNAVVYSPAPGDILDLGWSTTIYGSILVPEGTDVSDPFNFVNRPENVLGDPKIVTGPMPDTSPIPPPPPPTATPKPISWDPYPSVPTWGIQTIPGGDYALANNFSPGSSSLTVGGDLGLDIGRDLAIASSGGVTVNGDAQAWIARDLTIGGGGSGMTVNGDAFLAVGRNLEISAQRLVVEGDLDLSTAGRLTISGSGTMHVKGNAYLDIGDAFSISNGGRLLVDGNVVIRARDGLSFSGWQYPLVLGPNASVQVYVDAGNIAIASSHINTPYPPARFLVFGSPQVTSVAITGSGRVMGAFHTPAAAFSLEGSSQLFGAVVAQSIQSFGGDVAIHYDEALARLVPSGDPIAEQPLRRYWVAVGN